MSTFLTVIKSDPDSAPVEGVTRTILGKTVQPFNFFNMFCMKISWMMFLSFLLQFLEECHRDYFPQN